MRLLQKRVSMRALNFVRGSMGSPRAEKKKESGKKVLQTEGERMACRRRKSGGGGAAKGGIRPGNVKSNSSVRNLGGVVEGGRFEVKKTRVKVIGRGSGGKERGSRNFNKKRSDDRSWKTAVLTERNWDTFIRRGRGARYFIEGFQKHRNGRSASWASARFVPKGKTDKEDSLE